MSNDKVSGPLTDIIAGDLVTLASDGETYKVEAITHSNKPHELEYLALRNVVNHGLRTWSTGGHFEGMVKVQKHPGKPSPAIEAAAEARTRIGNTPEVDTDADAPEDEE